MQANEYKFLDDDNYIKELRLERQELKKERIKLQTLNLERNRLDREEARQELFYEQIGQYVQSKQYEKLKPLYVPHEKHMKYLLGIADIHANAKWKTMTNEYSMKIVKERFTILLDEVVTFIADKKLDEFNIVLLGDLVDGCLRMSNLQTMDSTVSKAIADISDIIIDFIEQIIENTHVHINLFDVVYANHSMPRFLQNYDVKEDLGYTINRYIRTGLRKNKNVEIFSPSEDDMYLDVVVTPSGDVILLDEDELKELYENLKGILYPEMKPDFHLNCDGVNCKHSNACRKTYLDCLRFSREDFPSVREEKNNG